MLERSRSVCNQRRSLLQTSTVGKKKTEKKQTKQNQKQEKKERKKDKKKKKNKVSVLKQIKVIVPLEKIIVTNKCCW